MTTPDMENQGVDEGNEKKGDGRIEVMKRKEGEEAEGKRGRGEKERGDQFRERFLGGESWSSEGGRSHL